jgi:acetate kinase
VELAAGVRETRDWGRSAREVIESLPSADVRAVGHRVVHGGDRFIQSTRIDEEVARVLEELSSRAPLHNPPALAAAAEARRLLPAAPHVAVFDTSFYADLPERARVYPLPYEWYSEWGIRRYGFHGINHAYCAQRAAELLGRDPRSLRLVSLHLGNGCSATAVAAGRPLATTMGFTPLEGLMMGTRSGSVDPGLLLEVLRRRGVSAEELEEVLNERSGLLGVSGVSSDYRRVSAAARDGHPRAALALAMYAERVREAVGAMAAALGGIDALLFTGGVGEHSAELRAAVCDGLLFLGLRLDAARNADDSGDRDVATTDSGVRALVVRAREELAIAREARRVSGAFGESR